MKTVQQLLSNKAIVIYSLSPDHTVLDALQLMTEKNISALLVIEQDETLGIFTERDYARKIVLQGKASNNTTLREVMTAHPITVNSSDTIDYCMELMTEKHIRHLPVVARDKAIAMVSIGDVVKFIIADQKQTIAQLENYINS